LERRRTAPLDEKLPFAADAQELALFHHIWKPFRQSTFEFGEAAAAFPHRRRYGLFSERAFYGQCVRGAARLAAQFMIRRLITITDFVFSNSRSEY
jgi:hypothetical protein